MCKRKCKRKKKREREIEGRDRVRVGKKYLHKNGVEMYLLFDLIMTNMKYSLRLVTILNERQIKP